MPKTYHYPQTAVAAGRIVKERFPLATVRDLGNDSYGYFLPSGVRVGLLESTDEGLVLEMDSSVDLYG